MQLGTIFDAINAIAEKENCNAIAEKEH